MYCSQCEVVIINDVICHEHGCPNSHKIRDDDGGGGLIKQMMMMLGVIIMMRKMIVY